MHATFLYTGSCPGGESYTCMGKALTNKFCVFKISKGLPQHSPQWRFRSPRHPATSGPIQASMDFHTGYAKSLHPNQVIKCLSSSISGTDWYISLGPWTTFRLSSGLGGEDTYRIHFECTLISSWEEAHIGTGLLLTKTFLQDRKLPLDSVSHYLLNSSQIIWKVDLWLAWDLQPSQAHPDMPCR